MHFGLFLAQDVQEAELAKYITTALHHTHHSSQVICLDVILAWLVWFFFFCVSVCTCMHVQSDSLEFMGDERGS